MVLPLDTVCEANLDDAGDAEDVVVEPTSNHHADTVSRAAVANEGILVRPVKGEAPTIDIG